MTIKVKITDGKGSSKSVKVTDRGQLVTAPLEFSEFYNIEANVVNTAFTLVPPMPGKRFIITNLILYANKSVGASDATVEVYESNSATSTIVDKIIVKQEMLKQTALTYSPLNVIVNKGKWVNVKTDDNTIFVNMAGYYVDA